MPPSHPIIFLVQVAPSAEHDRKAPHSSYILRAKALGRVKQLENLVRVQDAGDGLNFYQIQITSNQALKFYRFLIDPIGK